MPKRPSFEALVARILDEKFPGADFTKRERVARLFVDALLSFDAGMVREYLDRDWPKLQKHELSGTVGVASPEALESLEARLDLIARQGEEGEPDSDPGSG